MWYKTNLILYEEVKSLIKTDFPTLHIVQENNKLFIYGHLPLVADGKIIDEYELKILLPDNYPEDVPLVWETGGRIPRTASRHINTIDKSLCLFLIDERWKYYPQGATIKNFLDGPVYAFLLNQQYYDLTGNWLNGERGHGVNGIYEYYSEELNTNDPKVITNFLEYLSQEKIQRQWICYCGGGNKLRKCSDHKLKLEDMRKKIPKETARHSLKQIVWAINEVIKSARAKI